MERRQFIKYAAGAMVGACFCESAEAFPNGLFRVFPSMLRMNPRLTGGPAHKYLKQGIEGKLKIQDDSKLHLALKSSTDFVYGSSGTRVTPQFVYAGALSEGLDEFMDKYPGLDAKKVDGFEYLGLQQFGTHAPALRLKGYLPEDFREGRRFELINRMNEKNEPVVSGRFRSFEDAILATTAEYAWRRDVLRADLPELGIHEKKFAGISIDFWNYAYYIGGNGCGKAMLGHYAGKGILDKEAYVWDLPRSGYSRIHYLARERMASLEVMNSMNRPIDS